MFQSFVFGAVGRNCVHLLSAKAVDYESAATFSVGVTVAEPVAARYIDLI